MTWSTVTLVFVLSVADEVPDRRQRFVVEYERIVSQTESRLWKERELTVNGTAFDESGRVVGRSEETFRSSATCMLVSDRLDSGQGVTWHLLRPEGIYHIQPSAKVEGQFLLRGFRPGSFQPSEAGGPFSIMVMPLTRNAISLKKFLMQDNVSIVRDAVTGAVREVAVEEVFGAKKATGIYRFRTGDMLLEEFSGTDTEMTQYRNKYSYVEFEGESYPSRVERFVGKAGGELWLAGVAEFGPYKRASFNDSEFAPERFGLPPAIGYSSVKQSSTYLWLLAAAIVLFGLTVLFRHLGKRQRKAQIL